MKKTGLLSWLTAVVMTVCGSVCAQAQGTQPTDSIRLVLSELTPSQRYDQFFLEAMIQRQKGNDAAVFDLLTHCIEINPQASEAYYFLAQYYAALKDRDRSLEFFKRAAELSPDNATYLETLAQYYTLKGDYAEAAATHEKLYARHKDRDDLLEALYGLYLKQDDYDNAIRVLNLLEVAEGKSERLTYAKSEMYTQQGNKAAAIKEIKDLADKYPNDLNYLGLYADMLYKNEQQEQALQLYHHILAEEPDNARTLNAMRSYYKNQGDSVTADSITRRLLFSRNTTGEDRVRILRQEIIENERIGTDSTRVLALFHELLDSPEADAEVAAICAAYMELKQMPRDSVATVLHQILSLSPDNAAARLQLVAYAWDADDMETIISLCQEARQYNPDEMVFYYYQGMAYYKQDEQENALNAFRNGISVINEDSNPDIVSDFYAIMGDLLHQKGLAREAFEAYDSCLQHKPDNISCLNNYAYYLSELGQQLDKAEKMSYQTIKAEPKNPTFLDTYAWILFMQRRYSEAKIYIDQTLQNDTTASAVLLEHAGDIYYHNGDVAEAVRYWTEARAKDPSRKVLIRKIKQKKYVKE